MLDAYTQWTSEGRKLFLAVQGLSQAERDEAYAALLAPLSIDAANDYPSKALLTQLFTYASNHSLQQHDEKQQHPELNDMTGPLAMGGGEGEEATLLRKHCPNCDDNPEFEGWCEACCLQTCRRCNNQWDGQAQCSCVD